MGDLTTSPPGVGIDNQAGTGGVFVSVYLMPSGHTDTARLGSLHAGVGVGLMCPIRDGDEVLVEAPSGDPDEGLVIVAKLWSPSDPQPPGWNNDSVTLLETLPIQLVSPKVRIGNQPSGTAPGASVDYADTIVLGTNWRNAESTEHTSEETAYTTLITAMATAVKAAGVLATAATTWAGAPGPSAGTYAAAAATGATAIGAAFAAISTAATDLKLALTTYEMSASGYQNFLSTSGQIGL
jgi:hypothetical protein